MSHEWCRVDDCQPYQEVVVLRLQTYKQECQQVHPDKETIKMANANLVEIAGVPEVDSSYGRKDNYQDERGNLSDAQQREIKGCPKIAQSSEMLRQRHEVLLVDEPATSKPIRSQDA